MRIGRIIKHCALPPWQTRRCFNRETLAAIERSIAESEKQHRGELRFVLEGRLSLPQLLRDQSARGRAMQLFAQLNIGQTQEQSGILIYVLLAERKVEIVADRGIATKVAPAEWDALCQQMTRLFAASHYREGALQGIDGATLLLTAHFPARRDNPDELDNAPLIL